MVLSYRLPLQPFFLLSLPLLLLLLESKVLFLLDHRIISLLPVVSAHRDCDTLDPTDDESQLFQLAERTHFGKAVNDMSQADVSLLFKYSIERKMGLQKQQSGQTAAQTDYELVDIPIVYHILPNQNNGGKLRPSLTRKQAKWATKITNTNFLVYDKVSKMEIQFASFITDSIIVHDDEIQGDCGYIRPSKMRSIVSRASEWEYKMHVVVCESTQFSGRASFPSWYKSNDPLHNMVITDYRAFACYDDEQNFLCNITDGKKISNTRWWRTRSTVVAHEFGHLFGLFHTFEGGCDGPNDYVRDTPSNVVQLWERTKACVGLLPYNKDRDLFNESARKELNVYDTPDQCDGTDNVCGTTCAACCNRTDFDPNGLLCAFYKDSGKKRLLESLSEDDVNNRICCSENENRLKDSCISDPGFDPLNNIMSYVPDYCVYEFTPGQMMRMIAQIRSFKFYIYCNYANVIDVDNCVDVPCGSTATSPNCK